MTYLRAEQAAPPILSNLDPDPDDLGVAGARTALADNLTTGQFMGHRYTLDVVSVEPGGDVLRAARAALPVHHALPDPRRARGHGHRHRRPARGR